MKINSPVVALMGWLWGLTPILQAKDPHPELPAAVAQEATQPAASDPMGGVGGTPLPTNSTPKVVQTSTETPQSSSTPENNKGETETPQEKKPPLTPENANLNLATDLELETLDTREKIFLPAGTYRQILQIPIDSPTMQTAQKLRQDRRPAVKLEDPISPVENRPVWIRYESLEKIKINDEERRGGLDVPAHGPADLKLRLWYAKSETADTVSSVFYFIFGGLGYSAANLAGWSAGNTRAIPSDFEYRLIRR